MEAQLGRSERAFDEMMFAARCLIIDVPTTRTGLMRWTQYLRKLRIDWNACGSGSPYLPDKINSKPWTDTFLRALSTQLRKMGDGPSPRRKKPQQPGPGIEEFTDKLRGYLHQEMSFGRTVDQALDDLAQAGRPQQ
ncbi:hypothetical protein AYJ54_07965 [Bradyrhizobium centrolobii]|uniref:Uncharacterized protein n=2 Tax=Bradyrhizobium centrolobii TaxID=1505087 RepID=A0A176YYC8_9BRAD|nr:hypothetical protein AYJ54_07965 [Bradyrhizobium centrolobii]